MAYYKNKHITFIIIIFSSSHTSYNMCVRYKMNKWKWHNIKVNTLKLGWLLICVWDIRWISENDTI